MQLKDSIDAVVDFAEASTTTQSTTGSVSNLVYEISQQSPTLKQAQKKFTNFLQDTNTIHKLSDYPILGWDEIKVDSKTVKKPIYGINQSQTLHELGPSVVQDYNAFEKKMFELETELMVYIATQNPLAGALESNIRRVKARAISGELTFNEYNAVLQETQNEHGKTRAGFLDKQGRIKSSAYIDEQAVKIGTWELNYDGITSLTKKEFFLADLKTE